MNVMGGVSSVFDLLIFYSLWFILGYSSMGSQTYFQTGWFIEGLISQTIIVHFIRTSKVAFIQSRADKRLLLSSLLGITEAVVTPYALRGVPSFHFEPMPLVFYGYKSDHNKIKESVCRC